MQKQYGSTIWKYLAEFGVWKPGDPVALGDFGYRIAGCFKKVGNIRDLVPPLDVETTTVVLDDLSIMSVGTGAGSIRGEGPGIGMMMLSGRKDHNVLIQAVQVEAESVIDIRPIEAALVASQNWQRKYSVVTTVRRAQEFDVMISGAGGKAITLRAKAECLEAIAGGAPNLDGELKVELADGIRLRGKNGPISVGLHRQAMLGRSFKNAVDRSIDGTFERLVPVIDEGADDLEPNTDER